MSSCRFKLSTAVCAALIASTAAHAADIAVQPAAGSGFVFKDAVGANERLASLESIYNDLAEIKRQFDRNGSGEYSLARRGHGLAALTQSEAIDTGVVMIPTSGAVIRASHFHQSIRILRADLCQHGRGGDTQVHQVDERGVAAHGQICWRMHAETELEAS